MPETRELVASLTRIASEASAVAGAWHLVSGLALVGSELVGGAWRLLLASTATCYALFGALRLGVAIDWILLAGVLGLCVQHFLAPSRRAQLRFPWSTASVPRSADAATLGERFDTG